MLSESTGTVIYSAPMAGYTNYAHRELLRMFGGIDLIATEMVSARSFVELETRGLELPSRLWGVRDEPRPLSVQIWDNNSDTLSELAQRLAFEFKVSVIDLNFGCPAKQIAGRSASGSFLLQFPNRIGDIVRKVVDAAKPVPVTAKIRLGRTRDTINAIDVAQSIEAAGAAGLTVHGRTASEMYRGKADWEEIAAIKPKLKSIPLIGNGDIRTINDALFRIRHYPVDGIMIGRGGIDRPWLFRQIAQALRGEPVDPEPTALELRNLIVKHFNLLKRQFDDHAALILIQKTVCHYAVNQPVARNFRNEICSVKNIETFFHLIDDFFIKTN
ncbi:MAG: tRNA-dihydrouridine synthase [Planctomycetaceae bacterium]|jgi:tRNA-dihydrouridine synthase B|nr:tRNA-dihydrouridine synthase [Planctomycetaceae bacterium]